MNNEITYHKVGDYFVPNLVVKKSNTNNYHIGKYGHLRLNYLKEHKRVLYTELMINGDLQDHLVDIDEEANKRVLQIIKQLSEKEEVNEELKAKDQMEWVQAMNNIKTRAEEIVLNEIIYV